MPISHQQAREGFLRFMFGGRQVQWDSLSAGLQADIDGFLQRWPPGTGPEKFFKDGKAPELPPPSQPAGPDELSNDRQLVRELKAQGVI